MKKDKICIGIEVQRDIHTARRCILSERLGCDNKQCLNETCPLHKRWEKDLPKREEGETKNEN